MLILAHHDIEYRSTNTIITNLFNDFFFRRNPSILSATSATVNAPIAITGSALMVGLQQIVPRINVNVSHKFS